MQETSLKSTNVRVSQLDPVHSSSHVHLLGDEHCLLVPHDGLQIARK